MFENDAIKAYWRQYLEILPADEAVQNQKYTAERFGDLPKMADELGALIAAGTKTATCSALWEWEAEGESLPEVGLKTIVLDGRYNPLCIIELVELTIRPFNQVDEQFAYEEGEGDRTLSYWRQAHLQFFTRSLAAIGRKPTEDMPLVCERFRVIYK